MVSRLMYRARCTAHSSFCSRETHAVECLDDEHGIVDWPGEDYFATILREYLAAGRARQGLVGQAPSELIEAADLVDFGTAWMTARFRGLQVPCP